MVVLQNLTHIKGDDETLWDENSICTTVEEKKICYQEKKVPVHQGIFLRDRDGKLKLIAHTGYEDSEFDDFVFWVSNFKFAHIHEQMQR